jgi:hypothetical protein
MSFFFEIFQSNAEKAKLITVLLSTAIAVTIVFLNHSFTKRRSRKDLSIEKIEELYKVALNYEKKSMAFSDSISQIWNAEDAGNKDLIPEIENRFDDMADAIEVELEKFTMLMELYFPKENFDYLLYIPNTVVPSWPSYCARNPEWREHHKGAELVTIKAKELKNICKKLTASK